MTQGFSKSRSGRFVVRLDDTERSVLTMIAEQVRSLIAPPQTAHIDPLARELGLEDLDASMEQYPPVDHDDPALRRLFPAAYADSSAAQEFRRYTELGLRQQKYAALTAMIEALDGGTKITLSEGQAVNWLTAINDIRLTLAARMGIETEDDLATISNDDDFRDLASVYEFLSYLQESLIQALD